jgi:hypothetical protein
MRRINRQYSRKFRTPEVPGTTIKVTTVPPNDLFHSEKFKKTGGILLELGIRLTAEVMGEARKIAPRARTIREGRMLVTQIGLSVEGALLLKEAINEALFQADIDEMPSGQ